MNIFFRAIAFMLFLPIEQALSNRATLDTERLTLSAILNGYDPTVRPGGLNETGPVIVEVSTFIRQMGDIDDVKMAFDTQLTLRQFWRDDRLKYDIKDLSYITLPQPEKIWLPDLFFSDEDSGHTHNIVQPNFLIRIYPSGDVLYSIRISLRLFCNLNLKNYPLDYQLCNIHLASYAYTSENVYFLWKFEDAVQITKHLNLKKFKLNMFNQEYCSAKTPTGEYSCLKLGLFFSRHFLHFLETIYIPSAALVLMSWIVLWIHPNYSSIRFGIWVGILISLTIVATSISSKSPETPYRKALDVWLGMCCSFITLVFIELSVVIIVVSKSDASLRQNQLNNIEPIESNVRVEDLRKRNKFRKYCSTLLNWYKNCTTTAQKIDFVARFLFPIAFITFFVSYWIAFYEKQPDCDGDYCVYLTNP